MSPRRVNVGTSSWPSCVLFLSAPLQGTAVHLQGKHPSARKVTAEWQPAHSSCVSGQGIESLSLCSVIDSGTVALRIGMNTRIRKACPYTPTRRGLHKRQWWWGHCCCCSLGSAVLSHVFVGSGVQSRAASPSPPTHVLEGAVQHICLHTNASAGQRAQASAVRFHPGRYVFIVHLPRGGCLVLIFTKCLIG